MGVDAFCFHQISLYAFKDVAKKYLQAIEGLGAVSETALYTPLATHILSGPLNCPPKNYAVLPIMPC